VRCHTALAAKLSVLSAVLALMGCGSGDNIKTYIMPSESMAPTFEPEEEVTVNLDAYDGAKPMIGDAVIFHPPTGTLCGVQPKVGEPCPRSSFAESTEVFLKRIVAGPGDTLSIEHGHPVLNGQVQEEPFAAPCRGFGTCDMPRTIRVPEGQYFMLGDNRGASDDSRFWGPVPEAWIIGRVE
jgi:signal peptidase I